MMRAGWTDPADLVVRTLGRSTIPLKAREIAERLSEAGYRVDRNWVNRLLYGQLAHLVERGYDHTWRLKPGVAPELAPLSLMARHETPEDDVDRPEGDSEPLARLHAEDTARRPSPQEPTPMSMAAGERHPEQPTLGHQPAPTGPSKEGPHTVQEGAREVVLRRRLRGSRLVLEAGIDDEMRTELRALLSRLRARNLTVETIGERYPAIFVVYLVSEGLFSYREGNYWAHVPQSISGGTGAAAGRAFEDALARLNLESFASLFPPGVAYSRVNKILAHGGIPVHSLPDFFRLVADEIDRGVADPTEMLAVWRQSSWRLNMVTAPVERFLLHGGELAVDFLARCVDLVLDWPPDGSRPSPEEAGLPGYVLDAFAALTRTRRRTTQRRSLVSAPRPHVVLDPWSQIGPVLELPPTPPDADYPTWTIDSGAGVVRVDGSPFTTERVPLAPARAWECEYSCADGARRRFVFDGLSTTSILVFDPDGGRLLADAGVLTRRTAWLLHKDDPDSGYTVTRDGAEIAPRVTEHLPSPRGTWAGYAAVELALEEGDALLLGGAQDPRRLRVALRARPELVGDPVAGVIAGSGQQVYPAAPTLVVPEIEGASWTGTLRVDGDARILEDRLLATGRLDLGPFIGRGIARVELSVRGPLGSDASFSFCVVPGLACTLPTRLCTDRDGEIAVRTRAEPGIEIEPAAPVVEADSDRTRVEARDDRGQRLALLVQVPRLLWGVADQRVGARSLSTRMVNVELADLRDGTPSILDVRTGIAGTRMRLRLTAPREGTVQELEWADAARGRWSFDLDQFGDTAHGSPHQILVVVLDVDDFSTPVVRIARTYQAWDLQVAASGLSADGGFIELQFNENQAFNGRVVRAWPRWRPWEPAISGAIPDGVARFGRVASERLTVGEYLVEIAVEDEWLTPRRPVRPRSGIISATLGSAGEVTAYLDALPADDPRAALEAARADGRRLPALDALPEEHLSDALLCAADALAATRLGGTTEATLATLLGVVSTKPRPAFTALADLIERGRLRESETARLGLRGLSAIRADVPDPLEDDRMRTLWSGAPIIAAAVDLPAAVGQDEGANLRCDRYLGWSPRTGGDPPAMRGVDAGLLRWPGDRLEALRNWLQSQPQLLLDVGVYGPANLAWLIDQRRAEDQGRHPRPGAWFERHRWLIDEPIGVFECGLSRRVADRLTGRAPDPEAPPYARVPQLTIAAAAHLVAGGRLANPALLALDEAMAFCPGLVVCDVVRAIAYDELPIPAARG